MADDKPKKESHTRSLLKALSWRVTATATTMVIAYLITGEVKSALTIGAWEFALKFGIYYMHERAWQTLPRGTISSVIAKLTGRKAQVEKD